jgi:hypothetical protein
MCPVRSVTYVSRPDSRGFGFHRAAQASAKATPAKATSAKADFGKARLLPRREGPAHSMLSRLQERCPIDGQSLPDSGSLWSGPARVTPSPCRPA